MIDENGQIVGVSRTYLAWLKITEMVPSRHSGMPPKLAEYANWT
jgi:hypothetical protein